MEWSREGEEQARMRVYQGGKKAGISGSSSANNLSWFSAKIHLRRSIQSPTAKELAQIQVDLLGKQKFIPR